tara:strand:+ start:19 stop:2118 length:2100 start_codon:yes stop_codon:yes gene_type:complete
MANIKKNFNFRNGVQVDDDNLAVTATGLVGIGTTIPNEALDIRGNVIVTGFTSSTTAQIGVLTVTTFAPNQIVGAGLSVFSGIVTAQGAGILTYFGDARNLSGMPTSQWEDKDVGLGFTSIYNTGGNVGVGTEDPRTTLQIGNNVDAGEKGVGISSVGNINATGIVTASSFIGNVTGDVTGRITGDLVGNINSSGVSTAVTLDVNGDLDVDGHANIDNLSVAGVTTFTGLIDGNGGANIDNVQIGVTNDNEIDTSTGNLTIDSAGGTVTVDDQFAVTGVSTFTGLIDANGGATINNVQIGVTGNNEIDTSTGNLIFDSAGGTVTVDDQLGVSGIATFSNDVAVAGLTTTKNLQVTGTATFNGAISASSVEVPNVAVTTKLGIGTTETPASDIQVRKTSLAEVQITSTDSVAQLNVGKEVGTGKSNTGQVRFGGGAGAPYSASGTSLDIINYDTGNFNYHISGNNAAGVQGDFHWHKGINSSRLMTLTGIGGSLGIGITQPTKALDVVGAGNFSGDVTVGNNLIVTGALLGNVQGTLTGNVSGTLAGNTNTAVGISTLNNLTVSGVGTFTQQVRTASIGIGTDAGDRVVKINDAGTQRVFVTSTGDVGIRTTVTLTGVSINASQASMSIGGVGVGITILGSAVDLSTAGITTTRFVIMPKMNTSGRNGLQNVVSGSVIYNTQVNKLQVYNGTTWKNVAFE